MFRVGEKARTALLAGWAVGCVRVLAGHAGKAQRRAGFIHMVSGWAFFAGRRLGHALLDVVLACCARDRRVKSSGAVEPTRTVRADVNALFVLIPESPEFTHVWATVERLIYDRTHRRIVVLSRRARCKVNLGIDKNYLVPFEHWICCSIVS